MPSATALILTLSFTSSGSCMPVATKCLSNLYDPNPISYQYNLYDMEQINCINFFHIRRVNTLYSYVHNTVFGCHLTKDSISFALLITLICFSLLCSCTRRNILSLFSYISFCLLFNESNVTSTKYINIYINYKHFSLSHNSEYHQTLIYSLLKI